jgi:hypothetical protein
MGTESVTRDRCHRPLRGAVTVRGRSNGSPYHASAGTLRPTCPVWAIPNLKRETPRVEALDWNFRHRRSSEW